MSRDKWGRGAGPEGRGLFRESCEPPAFCVSMAVRLLVGGNGTVRDFVAVCLDDLGKHGDNRSTLISDDLLHFAIHLGPFFFIELCLGFDQELVETLMFPVGVIPGRLAGIGYRKHHVLGRTAAPIAHAKFFFSPGIGPVTIVWHPNDIDLDPGFLGMFLIQNGSVVRALKGRLGRVKIEGVVQHSGLFHVMPGLVRVVGSHRQVVGMVPIDGCDGMVVPGHAITVQDSFDHFFAVGEVFEGQTDIVVIVRLHLAVHGHGVMERAGHGDNLDPRGLFEQVNRFAVAPLHVVNLAGLERIGPCIDVGDVEGLDLVKVGPALKIGV